MTEKESVEALAERIVKRTCYLSLRPLEERTASIARILRHYIDRLTMQPVIEPQRDDDKTPVNCRTCTGKGWLNLSGFDECPDCGSTLKQPTEKQQPAEPVVTDEDCELAIAVASYCIAGVLPPVDLREVARIIAKARQAEREESRRLREELDEAASAHCQILDDWSAYKKDTQARLTAAEARVCELTDLAAKFRKNLLDIHEFAGRKMEQPATADAKGGK